MVPNAAVLGISHDDDGTIPDHTLLNGVNDARSVVVAPEKVGIYRVLIVCAYGLVEGDGRQGAIADGT